MAVNFWAAFNTIEAVLPRMRERKAGRIMNISSIGGKISIPHLLPHCASKFALTGYSHGLRIELAGDGIVVTTVCPGLMRTGSPRKAFFKGQHRYEQAWFSISDALPLLTISAEKAAEQILDACRRGNAEVILTLPAQVAIRLHVLFPDLGDAVLTLVNRLLPGPGGVGTEKRLGKESESAASPSVLTTLGDRAAVRNNEFAPVER
jgi:short-subunit dehydrogenase